jgi:hypothetical protein
VIVDDGRQRARDAGLRGRAALDATAADGDAIDAAAFSLTVPALEKRNAAIALRDSNIWESLW